MTWTRCLLPLFLMVLCIVISFLGSRYIGGYIPLNTKWLGYLIIIIALFNIVRTIRLIRFNQTSGNIFKDPSRFIKSGPFQYSRNPIYLGFLLMLIGFGLLFGTFSGFIGVIIVFLARFGGEILQRS